MALARELARNAQGFTGENPPVGCVIVKNGAVRGWGATAKGGRPHAETVALAKAGAASAAGADMYVTLEPCAHYGRTPPCADALAAARPANVYIGETDPDPRVSGAGLRKLNAAGVNACIINGHETFPHRAFTHAMREGRPFITVKAAITADGYCATHTGDSKWITGERARAFGRRLRAVHDAIIVGADTVIADNPALTCRIAGKEHASPARVVLDPHKRVSGGYRLFHDNAAPVYVISREEHLDGATQGAVRTLGCAYDEQQKRFNPQALMRLLHAQGLRSLLIEGGARTASTFIDAGLCDELHLFTAPALLGERGAKAFLFPSPENIAHARRMRPVKTIRLYPDICTVYRAE